MSTYEAEVDAALEQVERPAAGDAPVLCYDREVCTGATGNTSSCSLDAMPRWCQSLGLPVASYVHEDLYDGQHVRLVRPPWNHALVSGAQALLQTSMQVSGLTFSIHTATLALSPNPTQVCLTGALQGVG